MRSDYKRGLAVLVGTDPASSRQSPIPGSRMPLTGTRRWGDDRPTHLHAGVDLMAEPGTAVLAPEAGIVIDVARETRHPWTGYAPCVFMQGDSGRFHLLAHLSGAPIPVTVGQRVAMGTQVGTVGERERHSHWEVRIRDHRATDEAAITHSLSPSEWLAGRDVPFLLGDGVAVPTRRVPSPAPGRTGGDIAFVLIGGVVSGLITWAITRPK